MEYIKYDLMSAMPEMIILGMAMFIMLADLFLKQKDKLAIFLLSQVTLL
jgi:NADH-quinone oxidoreductase subunit N